MKQLGLFGEMTQFSSFAPDPPRNPDPPPEVSLALCASEEVGTKTEESPDFSPTTLREKLMERRRREQRRQRYE